MTRQALHDVEGETGALAVELHRPRIVAAHDESERLFENTAFDRRRRDHMHRAGLGLLDVPVAKLAERGADQTQRVGRATGLFLGQRRDIERIGGLEGIGTQIARKAPGNVGKRELLAASAAQQRDLRLERLGERPVKRDPAAVERGECALGLGERRGADLVETDDEHREIAPLGRQRGVGAHARDHAGKQIGRPRGVARVGQGVAVPERDTDPVGRGRGEALLGAPMEAGENLARVLRQTGGHPVETDGLDEGEDVRRVGGAVDRQRGDAAFEHELGVFPPVQRAERLRFVRDQRQIEPCLIRIVGERRNRNEPLRTGPERLVGLLDRQIVLRQIVAHERAARPIGRARLGVHGQKGGVDIGQKLELAAALDQARQQIGGREAQPLVERLVAKQGFEALDRRVEPSRLKVAPGLGTGRHNLGRALRRLFGPRWQRGRQDQRRRDEQEG